MFLIFGRKLASIGQYTHHEFPCKTCNDFDLEVVVYREYFHIFYIPIFPIGHKEAKVRCNTCDGWKWIVPVQQQYEKSSRTPFYFYTGVILFVSLILLIIGLAIKG